MAENNDTPMENVNGAAAAEPQVKPEDAAQVPNTDVLEEDDTFEEFEDRDYNDNHTAVDDNVEWEDNWDDEVEGEDDFSRRLRAELEAQKSAKE
ncbi:hypothetical protein BWQ96_01038 [Gracilariopsis chorda]|uniref:Uncharacterized protein n=1 Tax=Gracilariopsis chorda TaxID=448386 RepID=A0A2V3J4E4_9FLOR|nr:hypothetical protein BWQ96_01038 [Gracilariopsis chorda]|eukprot:PXF49249.1 hypothetical protein BWQ96_01038 [Gracilariopsis chorda]